MEKYYSQLIAFYYVSELMSFTQAATQLHCSKAHISKQIADLEHSIGAPLLYRNTRSVKLTFTGEALFKHAQSIMHELQAAESTVNSLQNKSEGLLRITSPKGYADYILAPNIPEFLKQFPDITLEMNHSGKNLDLVKEKIDIAIRITHEPPLDKVAKRIGFDRMVICATKEYLETAGELKTPQQLQQHACLVYSSERSVENWPFQDRDKPITIPVKARIASNSIPILLTALLNHQGIARLPYFVVKEEIEKNHLQLLLSDFYVADIPVYAIFSQSRVIPPKIHAFIRFLEKINLKN